MKKRWVAALLAALLLLLPAAARAESTLTQGEPLESELPMEADAVSVLLLDARSGTVILEKNADEQRPAASLTKLMTILLTLEALDAGEIALADEVTVSEAAAGMGGSQALLDAGGVYTVEDLLKSLIVASANDSAVALAELLRGSEDAFAGRMNERAAELGLSGTHYVNASGLPAEGQHTTARDIAALSLAQYFCELSMSLVPENAEAGDFLRLVLNGLYFLSSGKRPASLIKAVVEMRMLSLAGYMPDLIYCQGCGTYEADEMYFLPRQGTLYCGDCYRKAQRSHGIAMNRGVTTALRHTIYADFSKLFAFSLPEEGRKRLAYLSERYLLSQLDRQFATLQFYHQIFPEYP